MIAFPFRNEYVKINDEKGNKVLEKSCGSKNPYGISIAKRYAVIRMLSDGGIEKKGFHANYFLIDEESKGIIYFCYTPILKIYFQNQRR